MADDLDELFEVERGRGSSADSEHANGDDFPALRIIAIIYKVLAVIALVMGVLAILLGLNARSAEASLIALAWTMFVPLFLWGSGELIRVFLSIERNTRCTSQLLSDPDRRGHRLEPGPVPERPGT